MSKIIKDPFTEKYNSISRWILCGIVVLALDIYCFKDMFTRLWDTFSNKGVYFLLFVASITYIICRLTYRARLYENKRDLFALWVAGVCVVGLLYILMVYAFSYGVYPQISAGRGGGDYTDTSRIILHFTKDARNEISSAINKNGHSQELILIEDSANFLIVADPVDAGGPEAWRSGVARPQSYSVSHDRVAMIEYLSRKALANKP